MNSFFKKIKFSLINWFLLLLINLSNLTLRGKVVGKEKLKKVSPLILSTWHRYIWLLVYHFGHRDYYTLASLSNDGEYISAILDKMGWKVIRGSSSRGGARSLIKLYKILQKNQDRPVVLTPDGPTGPVYKVKPGIVYLQEKTGGYIVPLGVAVEKKKELNSWDKFVIPYPFSRYVLVIGDPVQLPETKSIQARTEILEKEMAKAEEKAQTILKKGK
ncbi:MAG: lysophospholipid acyltransferase family protein [Halanaerobiales bacterium]